MKKFLLILGMVACMAGLTACGQQNLEVAKPLMSQEDAQTLGQQVVETINQYVVYQAKDQVTDAVVLAAIDSWEKAASDMGDYIEITGVTADIDEKDAVINVAIKGSIRNANVEIVIDHNELASIATNVEYTFGEKMEKAVLNTLLGMGTVFVVLILISFIISGFAGINKLQSKKDGKEKKEEVKVSPVDNTIAQIIEKEELSDDQELVAVIAAAVAAYEGASSTDGFVVRSIKRSRGTWN